MDHTETIAYDSQEEIVKSLTVMVREPNEFTIEDFADAMCMSNACREDQAPTVTCDFNRWVDHAMQR